MKILVIYHGNNCSDGFGSAWVVRRYLINRFGVDESKTGNWEFRPSSYEQEPPVDIGSFDEVYIVDFSYPRHLLEKMNNAAKIILIDHHETAEKELSDLSFATFDNTRSGALISWDQLIGGEAPWFIKYISDRDLWTFELPSSREINCYIHSLPKEWNVWDDLCNQSIDEAIYSGEICHRVLTNYVLNCAKYATISLLDGYTVPVVNTSHDRASEVASYLCKNPPSGMPSEPPFSAYFIRTSNGLWQYGLRSSQGKGVNVGNIAKKFGGGGHVNSSGFVSKNLVHHEIGIVV